MHTVPTLIHGDLTLTDSNAIIMYLVDEFANDSSLFPTDRTKRATIINKLMFNATHLFIRWYSGTLVIYWDSIYFIWTCEPIIVPLIVGSYRESEREGLPEESSAT